MCIANHPVLYDIHVQELERHCADLRFESAASAQKQDRPAEPMPGGWIGHGPLWGGVLAWLRRAGMRTA